MSKALRRALARGYRHELGGRPFHEVMSKQTLNREMDRLVVMYKQWRHGKVKTISARVAGDADVKLILVRAAYLMGE